MHSCVSKKKFVEMQQGRLQAEEQVRNLTQETTNQAARIESLIADFEEMKNELLENNALKDQYIDSLNSEIFSLNELLAQQKESLQATSFTFGFEQQRMKQVMEEKDSKIRSLQSQIESLEEEVSQQAGVIDDKNFQISQLTDQVDNLLGQVSRAKTQAENLEIQLGTQIKNLKSQVNELQATMQEKDATIIKLQNNVKLLKNELGGNQ
jgi:chromosome segregation ATPase